MRLVIVAAPADAAERASEDEELAQAPSLRRTASLTAFPSAFLPASFGMTAFITLPMSFGERGAGFGDGRGDGRVDLRRRGRRRQIGLEHVDLAGLLVDEIGAAGLAELLDRVAPLLHERRTTCSTSASSRSRPFSTPLFMIAALSIRSADKPGRVLGLHRRRDVAPDLDRSWIMCQ